MRSFTNMDDCCLEFEQFINDLSNRLTDIGINLIDWPIDHVCYRVHGKEEFEQSIPKFIENSYLYTRRQFHDRTFYLFVLKKPFIFDKQQIPYLEFSEPGGSDDYPTGFQHLEILSTKTFTDMSTKPEKVKPLIFSSKYDDEEYLKWSDKLAVKITNVPLITKSLLADNAVITISPCANERFRS